MNEMYDLTVCGLELCVMYLEPLTHHPLVDQFHKYVEYYY